MLSPDRKGVESDDLSRPIGPSGSALVAASGSSSSSSSSNPFVVPPYSLSTGGVAQSASSTPMAMASLMGMDEGSNTSHASSSRMGGSASATGHANSSRQFYQPISLADALMRANGDETRALDEVLAERNKLCLEATKLGTENVRIWSLMKRIKRENEELKTTPRSAHQPSNPPHLQQPPLANAPLSPTPSSLPVTEPAQSGQVGVNASTPPPNATSVDASYASSKGSPLPPPLGSSFIASPGNPVRQLKGSDPSTATSSKLAVSSPLSTSVSAPPSASHFPLSETPAITSSADSPPGPTNPTSPTSPTSLSFSPREALQSPQQTSIMQQRAAAQANRLAAMASPGTEGRSSERNSLESHDFEAVDGSSVANSDESLEGGGVKGREDGVRMSEGGESDRRDPPARPDRTSRSSDSLMRSNSSASPRLDEAMLGYVNVAVVGTNLRLNERGKEDISFFITIDLRAPPSGLKSNTHVWKVEKGYADFLALDARLKQKHGKSKSAAKRISAAQLPDQSLFKDHAPSKVDQRKVMVEVYLQNLLAVSLPDKDDVCTFLCTDAIPTKLKDPTATTKEGFLTKKGLNLGRWVTRLYALAGPTLNYYEGRGGPHLGSISIIGAQIGRQQRSASADMDENSYRHAFLILESKPLSSGDQKQMVRHVLCAESDEERDDWVDVLVRAIAAASGTAANNTMTESNGRSSPLQPFSASSSGMPTSPTTPTMRKVALHEHKNSGGSRGGHREVLHSEAINEHSTRGPRQPFRPMQGPTGLVNTTSPTGSNPNSSSGPSGSDMTRSHSEVGRYSLDDHISHGGVKAATTYNSHLVPQQPHAVPPLQPRSRAATQEYTGASPSNTATTGDSATGGPLHLPESASSTSGVSSSSGGKERANALRPAISGPMNGTPIPTGYKFGGKEETSSASTDTKRRFWHRFGGAGGGSDKGSQPKAVFGVSLAESIAVSNVSEGLELPSVVYRCIEYLEKRNAAMEEGIYRLSGSSAVIKNLRDRFNAQGDVNLLAPSEPFYDPHAISGLLKQFLRELTNSVLTRELHFDFMRVNDITDRKDRVNELGHLVSLLPLANYSLLRTLCSHLIKVIELSDVNKMTMRNVGIVFSPTLGIPGGVFALFLTEFDWVFFTDAKGEPAPRQMEEDIIPPDDEELGIHETLPSPEPPLPLEGPGREEERPKEEAQSPVRPARRVNNNRSSWIAGNALHSGDGRVMMSLPNRDNRNSLSYNESEADRLLGGPQGRHRLSLYHEEMEAAIGQNPLEPPDREEEEEERLSTQAESPPLAQLSPSMSATRLQMSPRASSRKLQNPNNLTLSRKAFGYDGSSTHSQSGPNTPTSPTSSVRASRPNTNSHNQRAAASLQAVLQSNNQDGSTNEGH